MNIVICIQKIYWVGEPTKIKQNIQNNSSIFTCYRIRLTSPLQTPDIAGPRIQIGTGITDKNNFPPFVKNTKQIFFPKTILTEFGKNWINLNLENYACN